VNRKNTLLGKLHLPQIYQEMKSVLSVIFITCSIFLQSIQAQEDTSISVDLSGSFSNQQASLFKNYLNKEKEPVKLGSVDLSWNTSLENETIQLRYKFTNETDWNYTETFSSNETTYTLDSLTENKFFTWAIGKEGSWSEETRSHTIGMHLFENVVVKPGPEKVKVTWSIDYNVAKELGDNHMKAIISYNTDIGKKRAKKGMEGSDWMFTETFSLTQNKFEVKDLIGHEKYHFKIGLSPYGEIEQDKTDKSSMVWSGTVKAKTERGWGFVKFLILIGSLGFFIYGMKLMSEGLQQAAGSMLRNMLGSITKNRVKGVLTGFGITSLVQSSSVTTVMTVSFVNAGLMTLRQSAGVMMGANIGTTITAWIILIIGFKVSVGSYAYMLIALAFPLLFIKKGKAKAWATAIVGFCILFIGLGELKDAVPSLDKDSAIVQFFLDFKDVWYGPLMFVFLGALVTIVIQSSSAAMALTLAMVAKGAIPFEVACAMVLGENIGTTITAELASLIANVHAKRSARIHSMFNIVGVGWALLSFPLFLNLIGYLVGASSSAEFDPMDTGMAATGIALFHTMFNLTNVILLIWFVPQLVNLAERTVISKGESDEEFKLDFIGGPLGSTAELCILEAEKEVSKFGTVTARMNGFVKTIINNSSRKKKNKLLGKLEKYEEITDRVEVEIADYLSKAARLEMSENASARMRGMLSITNDLERVGDIYYQISKTLERKEQEKIYFTPEQRDGLNDMLSLVENAFDVMNKNLENSLNNVTLDEAVESEKEINQLRNKLRKKHLKQMETGEINIPGALIYANVFSSLEKVGDHIINVTEARIDEV